MGTIRISARIPDHVFKSFEHIALSSGYPTASALLRCVLSQFVSNRERVKKTGEEHTDWMREFAESHDHEDPRQRKNINERL